MPTITHLKIMYKANYNGCSVYAILDDGNRLDSIDVSKEVCSQMGDNMEVLEDFIIEYAYDFCDEDGEFNGNIRALRHIALSKASELLGAALPIQFEYDSTST